MSENYTATRSNAKSLTYWVRPGIEPASSWILVMFVSHNRNSLNPLLLTLHFDSWKNFPQTRFWLYIFQSCFSHNHATLVLSTLMSIRIPASGRCAGTVRRGIFLEANPIPRWLVKAELFPTWLWASKISITTSQLRHPQLNFSARSQTSTSIYIHIPQHKERYKERE